MAGSSRGLHSSHLPIVFSFGRSAFTRHPTLFTCHPAPAATRLLLFLPFPTRTPYARRAHARRTYAVKAGHAREPNRRVPSRWFLYAGTCTAGEER